MVDMFEKENSMEALPTKLRNKQNYSKILKYQIN